MRDSLDYYNSKITHLRTSFYQKAFTTNNLITLNHYCFHTIIPFSIIINSSDNTITPSEAV